MKPETKQLAKDLLTIWKWMLWGIRWMAVIVFGVLLIAGIMVKLPWKILMCLAIIPIVGIFVPKKIQPWVWLGLTVVIIAAFIWIQLPGSNSADWRVYQYDAEFETLQNERPLDAASNAAIQYQTLLDSYGESIFSHPPLSDEDEDALYNGPWDQADYPILARWLGVYQPGIDELVEIAQMPECRFVTPKTLPHTQLQMKRLNQMKRWARMLLWSANQDLAEGERLESLEKQWTVLRMAKHLYQQQTFFDQSAAFDIELLAFRAFYQYIVEYCDTPETLDALTQAFGDVDTGWAKSWGAILDREKLITKNIMGLLYETNTDGDTRIGRSAMYALQEGLGYTPHKLFLRQHEMNRLAVIALWLSLPASPQGIADLIDKRFDHYSLLAQKGDTLPGIPIQYSWRMGLNVKSLIDWFAIERARYFWALHNQNKRHLAIVDLIHVFSELKKYRLDHDDWPESLEELQLEVMQVSLVDPVHGKPFMYQKTGDGFYLYSLGPNGIDDNGVNNPVENKDDIVFWPRTAAATDLDDGSVITEKQPISRR